MAKKCKEQQAAERYLKPKTKEIKARAGKKRQEQLEEIQKGRNAALNRFMKRQDGNQGGCKFDLRLGSYWNEDFKRDITLVCYGPNRVGVRSGDEKLDRRRDGCKLGCVRDQVNGGRIRNLSWQLEDNFDLRGDEVEDVNTTQVILCSQKR